MHVYYKPGQTRSLPSMDFIPIALGQEHTISHPHIDSVCSVLIGTGHNKCCPVPPLDIRTSGHQVTESFIFELREWKAVGSIFRISWSWCPTSGQAILTWLVSPLPCSKAPSVRVRKHLAIMRK